MSLNKVQDPSLSQSGAAETYRTTYNNNVDEAHQLVTTNNWQALALNSANINQIITALYSQTEEDLQSLQFKDILGQIGIAPIKNNSSLSFTKGQRIYINSELDAEVYLAIQNVPTGISYTNTKYWEKVPNYYTESSLQYIYQQWIDRLKIQDYPIWETGTTYYKNNIVICPDESCIAICINTDSEGTTAPVTDSGQWIQFSLKGDIGAPSLNVKYRGTWDSSTTYMAKDMVLYEVNRNVQSSINNDSYQLFVATETVNVNESAPNQNTKWVSVFKFDLAQIPIVEELPNSFDYPYNSVFIVNNGNDEQSQLYTSQLELFDSQVLLDNGWKELDGFYYGAPNLLYNKILWDNTDNLQPPYTLEYDVMVQYTVPENNGAYLKIVYTDGTTELFGQGYNFNIWTHLSTNISSKVINYISGTYTTNANTTYWRNITLKSSVPLYPQTYLSLLAFDSTAVEYTNNTKANLVLKDMYNYYNLGGINNGNN